MAARQLPRGAVPRRPGRPAQERRAAAVHARRAPLAAGRPRRGGVRGDPRPARGAAGRGRGLRHRHRLPGAARLASPDRAAGAGRPAGGRRGTALPALGGRAVRARRRRQRPRGHLPGGQAVGRARALRPRRGATRTTVLVRPDGYIAWATDETAPDRRAEAIRDALSQWCGRGADH
ncbi:hypothetical protein ACFQY7_15340 [Actinomadura luteofluorescens]|uniref:aromatic-ring hydroxylase C-terminal domain-containing protein n=1 Tax=Actinomadura luteofluorescens TaxID=46163 RepID=UPI003629764C